MPAYLMARCKVSDPVEYKKYSDLAPAIVKKYGGKVMSKAGRYQVTEGTDRFHRFVLIEFPTFEDAVNCVTSEEYKEAAKFRRAPGVGEVEQVIVEAGEP
jgi:uncharacterized protein (DUF1330 family)